MKTNKSGKDVCIKVGGGLIVCSDRNVVYANQTINVISNLKDLFNDEMIAFF